LRWREREQLADRVDLIAGEDLDRAAGEAGQPQGRGGLEVGWRSRGDGDGDVVTERDDEGVAHGTSGREALFWNRIEGLQEEGGEAGRVDVVLTHGRGLAGLGDLAVEGVAAGVELEQAERSGEAIGGVGPARAAGVAV
jgi:hypothetical protein